MSENIPEQEEEFVERRQFPHISPSEHYEHHMFVREWIERERRKREWSDKVKAQVSGWIIISVITAVGTGAYNGYLYIKDHLK